MLVGLRYRHFSSSCSGFALPYTSPVSPHKNTSPSPVTQPLWLSPHAIVLITTYWSPKLTGFSPLLDRCIFVWELKNSIYLKVLQDSLNWWPSANVLPFPHEKILCKLVRSKEWIAPHAICSTFSCGLNKNNSTLSSSHIIELTVPPTDPVGIPSTKLEVRSTDFEGFSSSWLALNMLLLAPLRPYGSPLLRWPFALNWRFELLTACCSW